MKRASTGRQESLRFGTGQNGFTSFSFMFTAACWQGSVRVNQELDAGSHGSKEFTMRSAFRECSHTQPDLNRVHTELKPYRPGSTRIDQHCNPVNSWWIPRVRCGGEKSFGHVQNFYTDFDCRILLYPSCNGLWQGLTSGSIEVEKDLKRISIRFETRKNFELHQNIFSSVS
jgi:hypothetical protein